MRYPSSISPPKAEVARSNRVGSAKDFKGFPGEPGGPFDFLGTVLGTEGYATSSPRPPIQRVDRTRQIARGVMAVDRFCGAAIGVPEISRDHREGHSRLRHPRGSGVAQRVGRDVCQASPRACAGEPMFDIADRPPPVFDHRAQIFRGLCPHPQRAGRPFEPMTS